MFQSKYIALLLLEFYFTINVLHHKEFLFTLYKLSHGKTLKKKKKSRS